MKMDDAKSLLFLGRQPALGLAELESLYGADTISLINETVAGSKLPAKDIDFSRLGGSIKLASVIGEIESTDWRRIEKVLLQQVPITATLLEEGKIQFGLSIYGLKVGLKDIEATALRLKKAIRAKTNQSVRVTPNKESALSSAQVLHNHLTGPRGLEIVLVKSGNKTILGRTVAEQDIEAYAKRDQNRPKRDARVGMLPPKLAQIIVNLAVGNPKIIEDKTTHTPIVLDPFCGTGVILQEALLMEYHVIGTDIESRMIEYTQKNIEWLYKERDISGFLRYLAVGDATQHQWLEAHVTDAVACEGYLGQPFNTFPSEEKLREVMNTCNQIMKGFLKNIAGQIQSGTRLCVALPAWHRPNGTFEHLKLLDSLEELGYNRVVLKHVRNEELLYYRPDQVVARELLILTKQ
jgi:tRNA G10  N-methylase Trm11